MASGIRLMAEPQQMFERVYELNKEADEKRNAEYASAVRLQAWARGMEARNRVQHLNASATIVQRVWRGFLGRRMYLVKLRELAERRLLVHYDRLATLIQKRWRGYYTRKYRFDFYKTKQYLRDVQCRNEEVKERMCEYGAAMDRYRREMAAERAEQEKLDWASRHHFLLSTRQIDGVYRSPTLRCQHRQVEALLESTAPRSHSSPQLTALPSDQTCRTYEMPAVFSSYKRHVALPPIGDKPQGPFREAAEVRDQRFKPLRPTLRVQHDYYSVEAARRQMQSDEWAARWTDERFKLAYPKACDVNRKHRLELNSTVPYQIIEYGTKHFRYIDRSIAPCEDFKLVQPPIPLFDRLNDTYSKGQEA